MGVSVVSLAEILDARERRSRKQRELLARFGKPLICFTMNIPGPVKNSGLISAGFRLGLERLKAQLAGEGIRLLHSENLDLPTGWEGYYVADGSSRRLKELTAAIEDGLPVGRLFDLDVLEVSGRKVERQSLGLPVRRCLMCDRPAMICARSRAHPVEALRERTEALLLDAVRQHEAREIARVAIQSLLYEVCVTPKPGLVDRNNSGSHRDMDIFTFMASTAALGPYFEDCARAGMDTQDLPPYQTFGKLRFLGKGAEWDMLGATAGVNTHKGAIFTLGLLCGGAGRLPPDRRSPDQIAAQCAAMTQGLTCRDLGKVTAETAATAGQRLYARWGITGVRGQAEAGFPAVLETGLPTLERCLGQGMSFNDAGCVTLLALLTTIQDTNIMARSGPETLRELRRELTDLLACTPCPPWETLLELDRQFIERNLSPGGAADLLAATCFLHLLSQRQEGANG